MKKIIFVFLLTFLLMTTFAQLKNTKWDGTIKGDNPQNAILDFKTDTLILYAASNNKVIETMTFSIKGNSIILKKIIGQSDCDNMTLGNYGFVIKGNDLFFKINDDACEDRSSALDLTKWSRLKRHEN